MIGIPFCLAEVRFQYVLQHLALGVEERTVQRDGVAHHVDEPAAVIVKERDDDLLQLVVQ